MSKMLSKDDLARIFKPIKQYKTDKLIEILTELANYVSEAEQQKADAVKKVEEFNKDEEIVKLKKQLKEKRERAKNTITFTIDSDCVEKIRKWKEQHEKEKHNGNSYAGAVGGRYTYEFTPTSIGEFGRIRCSCGDHFDFDDGSDW